MYLASLASVQPSFSCWAITASIFVFCSGVRLRLANETSHAIFPLFAAWLVQSPCEPANIVPAANIPAATNAMSLVIEQTRLASWVCRSKSAQCGYQSAGNELSAAYFADVI